VVVGVAVVPVLVPVGLVPVEPVPELGAGARLVEPLTAPGRFVPLVPALPVPVLPLMPPLIPFTPLPLAPVPPVPRDDLPVTRLADADVLLLGDARCFRRAGRFEWVWGLALDDALTPCSEPATAFWASALELAPTQSAVATLKIAALVSPIVMTHPPREAPRPAAELAAARA
jgi:hypothetical protein